MILGEVPVAPLIPEAVWTVIGIGTLAFFVVMLGVKIGYDYTLGALFRLLAGAVHGVPLVGHKLAHAVESVDNNIQSAIASGLLASETVLGKWWYYQKELAQYTYDSLAYFAHQTVGAFDSLIHGTVPTIVNNTYRPVAHDIGALRTALHAETVAIERALARKGRAIEAELDRDFGLARAGIDFVRGTLATRLAHLAHVFTADIAALRAYTHRVLSRRLSRLETAVFGAALTGTVLAVLTRYFPYWRCTNVRRFMRGVCRSPFGSLDWLFALSFEALLVSDLCDFIAAVSGAARAVEPELLAFVQLEDVLIGCHGATKPRPLPIPALDAPPVQAGIALGL